MRPLDEVLETVLLDRGGAPLHFVLAHAVFWIESSAEALRWLSVVCAAAVVPVCFDLGRRLAGPGAGLVAAAVAASSTALAVYGTFGRMYALLVLVAALSADLFVRAVHLRTPRAVATAAAAAWLLPAVHPYGAIPAFAELIVALILWRRRSFRPAVPVALAALATVPFLLANFRLADRAAVGSGGSRALASPSEAWDELVAALSAFAGGNGIPLAAFVGLAVLGLAILVRREPAVAAVALTLILPPILFVFVRTGAAPDLSPRHLFYGLPLWAAAIGVATAWLRIRLPERSWQLLVAGVVVLAVLSPASALRDPRELFPQPAAPERGVRAGESDLLIPYSTVFLMGLGAVNQALALPHAPGEEILSSLEDASEPIGAVHLAIPTDRWTVLRLEGPFDRAGALEAAAEALAGTEHPRSLDPWFSWIEPGICDALNELRRPCPEGAGS